MTQKNISGIMALLASAIVLSVGQPALAQGGANGIPGQIAELNARVQALQSQLNGFQVQISPLNAWLAQLQAIEQQIATLEGTSQPLSLNVNCASGQTVSNALSQQQGHTGPLTITIIGTCVEQVQINRNDVTLQGGTPADGFQAPTTGTNAVINVAGQRIQLQNLTITGGQRGIFAGNGGAFFGNYLTVTGTQGSGIEIAGGGTGGVSNSTIDRNANNGVSVDSTGYLMLTNCDISNNGFMGVFVNSGRIDLFTSTVNGNAIEGIQSWVSGTVRMFGGAVTNNTFSGIDLMSNSTLQVDQGATISSNGGGGIALSVGSVADLRSVTISGNHSDGVSLLAGSNLQLSSAGTIVINGNAGNGITAQDTSVLWSSGSNVQISQNTGWGILCSGPPAVAQIAQRGPGLASSSVFGNAQGQISCPGDLVQ